MDFRISDTFTDSLARLTGEEQKNGPKNCFWACVRAMPN